MDGNKKIARIYIPIILLAFVSCHVQKPIGISLFESKADTFALETIIRDTLILPLSADSVFLLKNPETTFDIQTEADQQETVVFDSVFLLNNPNASFDMQTEDDQQDTVVDDSLIQVGSFNQSDTESEISRLEQLITRLDSMLISHRASANKSDSINNLLLHYLPGRSNSLAKRDTIVIINQIFLSDAGKADVRTMADSSYLSANKSGLLSDSISVLLSEVNKIKTELASYSAQRSTEQKTIAAPDPITPSNPNDKKNSYISSILLKEKSDSILHLKEENLKLKNELANRIELSKNGSAKSPSETINKTRDSLSINNKVPELPPIIEKRKNIDSLANISFSSDTILISENKGIDSSLSRPPYSELIRDEDKSIKDSTNTGSKNLLLEPIVTNTDNVAKNEAREKPLIKDNSDSTSPDTMIIAYYHSGEITAYNEKDILLAIKSLVSAEKVNNVFLSAYTDISGTPDINMVFSKKRAESILEKLLDLGISRDLIFMQYFGSSQALQQIDEKDRRVKILISYK